MKHRKNKAKAAATLPVGGNGNNNSEIERRAVASFDIFLRHIVAYNPKTGKRDNLLSGSAR